MQPQPVITAGAISGLILAFWDILVQQGVFTFLTEGAQNSLNIFVSLLVPIVAAVIASRMVTPTSAPNLPIGTVVNEKSGEPTGVVVPAPGN